MHWKADCKDDADKLQMDCKWLDSPCYATTLLGFPNCLDTYQLVRVYYY